MDARVQRLDPAVEHLREPGHGRDVGDRQAPLAQGPGRAAGRHELEPEPDEARREREQAALVRHGQQRAARSRHGCVGELGVQAHVTAVDA